MDEDPREEIRKLLKKIDDTLDAFGVALIILFGAFLFSVIILLSFK